MKPINLFESKTLGFLIIRSTILLAVLSIVSLLFVKDKWVTLAGLILGFTFSIFRFSSTEKMLKALVDSKLEGSFPLRVVFIYVVNLLAMITLMAVSIKVSIWLFGGITCGILLVPFIITVNAFTEGLGITHNKFE